MQCYAIWKTLIFTIQRKPENWEIVYWFKNCPCLSFTFPNWQNQIFFCSIREIGREIPKCKIEIQIVSVELFCFLNAAGRGPARDSRVSGKLWWCTFWILCKFRELWVVAGVAWKTQTGSRIQNQIWKGVKAALFNVYI